MSDNQSQQSYAQGYHVGYQHGLEAGKSGASPDSYPIDMTAAYPERSSRLLMFFFIFKPLLLLPHLIVLWVLSFAVAIVVFISWWAVVITGRYPRSFWDFMVGVYRWYLRVQSWMLGLTDKYPPFSLR